MYVGSFCCYEKNDPIGDVFQSKLMFSTFFAHIFLSSSSLGVLILGCLGPSSS